MEHLTDTQLQQHALGEALPPDALAHLQHCAACEAEAAVYKSLSLTLPLLEAPAINPALVDAILRQTASRPLLPSLRRWALTSALLLLASLLPALAGNTSSVLPWSIALAGGGIGLFEALELWQHYRRQEQQLFTND